MRSRKRWPGCLVAACCCVLAAALLVVFRQPVGRFAARTALGFLARSTNATISYKRLAGDVFRHPEFEGLTIVLGSDSLLVRRLAFSYDLVGFLRGLIPLSEMEVVGPRLYYTPSRVRPDTLQLRAKPELRFPRLNLRRLRVRDGALYLSGKPRLDSMEFVVSVRSRPSQVRARLEGMRVWLVQEELKVEEVAGLCRLTRDSLMLSGLRLRTAKSRLTGAARLALDGSSLGGEIEEMSIELAEFVDWPGRAWAKGTAGVKDGARQAELEYSAEGLRFRDVGLPRVRGRLDLDGSELHVEVAGADSALGGFELEAHLDVDSLEYRGEARLTGVAAYRFGPGLPESRVDAQVWFSGRGTDSLAASLVGRIRGVSLDSVVAAGVVNRGRVEIQGLYAYQQDNWLWLSGSYDAAQVDASGVADSFDLAALHELLGVDVAGRLSGVFTAQGRPDSLALSGGIRVFDADAFGVAFQQGLAEFDLVAGKTFSGRLVVGAEDVSARGYEFDAAQLMLVGTEFDLRFDRPGDRLVARGAFRLPGQGVECTVTMLSYAAGAETLAVERPFELVWIRDSLAISGAEFVVADGTVKLDLRRVGSGLPEAEVAGTGLNLRKLQKLSGLGTEIWGTVDFSLTGSDSLRFSLAGTDFEVPSAGILFKRLGADAAACNGRIELDRAWAVREADTTVVTGSVGYELAGGFKVRDLDLSLEAADPGVWVFGFLKQYIEVQSGKVYGSVTVKGDPARVELGGRVRLAHGELFVPSVNSVVEKANAELTFEGRRVVLEKLSGSSGKGLVTMHGLACLGDGWSVDSVRYAIKPNGASVSPSPEVYAIVSGDVVLTWVQGEQVLLAGTFDVEEALLAYRFGQQAGGGSSGGGVAYDLRIRGDRGIWLRNNMADIELSMDLSLRSIRTQRLYSGQLVTRQGNFYYLDHTLKVTRGVITFDNITEVNPGLDIVAELPVRVSLRERTSAPEKVVMSVAGTLEQPEFRFSSEPPGWDENEIVTYLSLNVTTEELSAMESREMVTKYLSERFFSYLQTQGTKWARKFIGLDELRFESEFTGGEGNKVTVGKYVGRNLYVTYTQNFTGDLLPAVQVEYYLNRRNELVGERTEDGRYSVLYRFKLRY